MSQHLDPSSDAHQDRFAVSSLLIPLGLLVVTFLAMVAFQTSQLLRERENLGALRANQETAIGQATRLRQQLDSIAGQTARLAEQGNANAKVVIDRLKQQGITVNPNASTEN